MWKRFVCLWAVWSLACGDDVHTCTAKACGGLPPSIPLVDERGLPVVARGEIQNPDGTQPSTFDCTVSAPGSSCQTNLVFTGEDAYWRRELVQIRFEQTDGSFTPWEPVDIQITSHTDPDFNGPDCSCTWYTAMAPSVVVPVTARLSKLDAGAGRDAG
jgi:hypothetical protein